MTKRKHERPAMLPAGPAPRHDLRTKHAGDTHIGNFLQASYQDSRATDRLARKGYRVDSDLSSSNQSVFVNPRTKRMVVAVAGTHNGDDVATDTVFAFGGLKDTPRYKEARGVLNQARDKYLNYSTSVVGHSLGGAIASGIARPGELAVTYNKAATFGTTTRPNEQAFRQEGDVASVLASGNTNMTNLPTSLLSQAVPVFGPHALGNLQGQPLFL